MFVDCGGVLFVLMLDTALGSGSELGERHIDLRRFNTTDRDPG
jgi:hypothetical protein